MTYDALAFLARTLGLIWMMGFFIIVIIRVYNPRRRAEYDQVGRSIFAPDRPEGPK